MLARVGCWHSHSRAMKLAFLAAHTNWQEAESALMATGNICKSSRRQDLPLYRFSRRDSKSVPSAGIGQTCCVYFPGWVPANGKTHSYLTFRISHLGADPTLGNRLTVLKSEWLTTCLLGLTCENSNKPHLQFKVTGMGERMWGKGKAWTLESERPVSSHPGCVILGKFPNLARLFLHLKEM